MPDHIDMVTLHNAMIDLRAANECEAAAAMDLEDAKAALAFHHRKVEAMQARLDGETAKVQRANDTVAQLVAMETAAPLSIMEALGK